MCLLDLIREVAKPGIEFVEQEARALPLIAAEPARASATDCQSMANSITKRTVDRRISS